MKTWWVILKGQPQYIQYILGLDIGSRWEIQNTSAECRLKIPGDFSSDSDARDAAEALVRRINGICNYLNRSFQPLLAGDIIYSNKKGVDSRNSLLTLTPVFAVGRVADVSAGNHPPHSMASALRDITDLIDLSEHDPSFRDVSDILGNEPMSWDNLWRIKEIIYADVGNSRADYEAAYKLGFATLDELNDFHASIGFYKHARHNQEPPPKLLNLFDAEIIGRQIVKRWGEHKIRLARQNPT